MKKLYLFPDDKPCQSVLWQTIPSKGEIVYYQSIRYSVEEVVHDIDSDSIKIFMVKTLIQK